MSNILANIVGYYTEETFKNDDRINSSLPIFDFGGEKNDIRECFRDS